MKVLTIITNIQIILLIIIVTHCMYTTYISDYKWDFIEKVPTYQVILIGNKRHNYRYPHYHHYRGQYVHCGGTLLNQLWILTAAHCTQNIKYFAIYMGRQELNRTDGIIMHSNEYIRHEGFVPSTAANDIALVKLPHAINYTKQIGPAILPFTRRHDLFYGLKAISVSNALDDNHMKVVDMLVITNKACSREYNGITAGILCTASLKSDTVCLGDSGGPLTLKGTRLVIGITSFGPLHVCDRTKPNGFTRITYYLDWIIINISRHTTAKYRRTQMEQYFGSF